MTQMPDATTPSPPAHPALPRGPASPGDPYCANCGYVLTGLTDVARCPECGRPIIETLVRVRGATMAPGTRYRSPATLLGSPLVEIARGPREDLGERSGTARGWIAIGDTAIGGLALGGRAVGVVAAGGVAIGGASLGGMSIGAISAAGGGAIGGWAAGGGAAGVIANGGGAIGVVAAGGGAAGVYVRAGGGFGRYVIDGSGRADAEAVAMFQRFGPLMLPGPGAPPSAGSLALPFAAPIMIWRALGALIGLIVLARSGSRTSGGVTGQRRL